MDWSAPVDAYCERTVPSFWAEPANALSNAAFLIAAALAFAQWRRTDGRDWPALLLIGITAVVGTGSFVFHAVATRWAVLADVIPIAVFIYAYFLLAMRRFCGLGIGPALALTIGFALAATGWERVWGIVAARLGFDPINGSAGYLPAAVALFGVGLSLTASGAGPMRARHSAGRALLLAGALFGASLAFRSVDLAICAHFPLGTHVAWHVLNGAVLYVLLRAAIAFRVRERGRRP